ncbi:hypothetical protein KBB96_00175 [Luteolibacter ambystomatis]|uniref:Uncharacterized protein n=1 Tax=Luteolibacter ambystomatis TaxID=2824561 RepID=A0A975IZI4_9BACT|nr:hypothetical protein [Luteolibacter ambystomatis]QUE51332.1 hypothetical protein KBB96_00175 [Luteolibacter ambystomatis]
MENQDTHNPAKTTNTAPIDAGVIHFNQPELTGPGGYPTDISERLLRTFLTDIEDIGNSGGGFIPLEGMSDEGRNTVLTAENEIRFAAREHARIFTPFGLEVFRKSGTPEHVPVDARKLQGNIATHNHPLSTPPSLRDLVTGVLHHALEIRVCSPEFTYSVRFTGAVAGDIVNGWRLLDPLSYVAGQEWLRSQKEPVTPEILASRRLHAALMELARRELILYHREANVPL